MSRPSPSFSRFAASFAAAALSVAAVAAAGDGFSYSHD
jgi:hypothetical protein